jgi:thiamine biosynthesis lipoprotein
MSAVDREFPTMGGRGRVVLEAEHLGAAELARLARAVQGVCDDVEARLSRFDPGSELSRFNRGELRAPASPLLRRLAAAARWAGEASDGLVDATLLGELRRSDAPRAPLADALRAAPPRRPACADGTRAYARLRVGPDGVLTGAPGAGLDSGGLAKGLAADLAAAHVPGGVRHAISVCGDVAVGGGPRLVPVEPAVPGGEGALLHVPGGGVATSGISARLWQRPDGTYAHHLLDASTGEPAWTGLVAVSAVAPSALGAEVLAKHALLAGPRRARRLLRRHGGVLQHEDGTAEAIAVAPVVRLAVPA